MYSEMQKFYGNEAKEYFFTKETGHHSLHLGKRKKWEN